MLRKKEIFSDGLYNYDILEKWNESGDDATYISNNNYLSVYKTNSDNVSNFLHLTAPFVREFDFIVEIDFKIIQKSADSNTKIVELSNRTDGYLTKIDSDDQGGEARGVWGDGDYVYLANGTEGLHVYSVDGDGNFTHIDSDDPGGEARGVWGDENFIYLANGINGIYSYYVDDSGILTNIDSDDQGEAYGVWGDGKFIFVAFGTTGIHSYSVDNEGYLTHIDSDNTPGCGGNVNAFSVWGDGNFIYLTVADAVASTGSVHSYSVDSSGSLTHIDSENLGDEAWGVWGDGNFVYVANDLVGLRSYSIDSDGNFTHIDTNNDGDRSRGVWGDDNFIYTGDYSNGISSYSVDSRGYITYIDTNDPGADVGLTVWSDGTYIYLAHYTGGIVSFSLTHETRGYINVNVTTPKIQFFDEDDSQIGSDCTLVQNRWFRAKIVQSFSQQSSTTGKISAYIKDLSDPNNDWEYIGTNSTQSGGINTIKIGHPEANAETFQYQFKKLAIYKPEEFP